MITPERYVKIRALADKLIADGGGGADYWLEIEDLSVEEATVLDGMALECHVCNQWFDAREMVDDGSEWACSDCAS